MHVAAWHRRNQNQTSPNSRNKCIHWPDPPNNAKFCVDPTRNVRDIDDRKFVLLKSGPNLLKSLKTCYPLKPPPISRQISSISMKPPWIKALQKILHPSIIWLPGGPPGPNVTGLGGGVQQPSYLQNLVPLAYLII